MVGAVFIAIILKKQTGRGQDFQFKKKIKLRERGHF